MIVLLIGMLFTQQPAREAVERDVQPFDSVALAFSEDHIAQDRTVEAEVRRIATQGWLAARAIAPKGGAVDLLGPVNVRLKELDAIPNMSARYAETAIRAAVSAAQEERDEMGLLLAHARSLSEQMSIGASTPPEWPLPIDELEGELWFEVDRFREARDAFERATKVKPTANAWIGLARASDRLADTVTACRAYTSAAAMKNLPSAVELEISVYALKCRY